MICKDNMITLLSMIEKETIRRRDTNNFEEESDKWEEFRYIIKKMKLTIKNGGIK